jgi:hypothetical protein
MKPGVVVLASGCIRRASFNEASPEGATPLCDGVLRMCPGACLGCRTDHPSVLSHTLTLCSVAVRFTNRCQTPSWPPTDVRWRCCCASWPTLARAMRRPASTTASPRSAPRSRGSRPRCATPAWRSRNRPLCVKMSETPNCWNLVS